MASCGGTTVLLRLVSLSPGYYFHSLITFCCFVLFPAFWRSRFGFWLYSVGRAFSGYSVCGVVGLIGMQILILSYVPFMLYVFQGRLLAKSHFFAHAASLWRHN
jgi:hypothetical protein